MKPILQQHKIHKRHLRRKKTLLRFVVSFFLLGSAVAVLLLLPQLFLIGVSVEGSDAIPAEDIAGIANAFLEEKVAGMFPRRNIVLFRAAVLEMRILAVFPAVREVVVSRSLREGVFIEVAERDLWGVYCAGANNEVDTPHDACFYIATDGTLMDAAPRLTGNSIARIIDMRADAGPSAAGDHSVDRETAERVHQVSAWLSAHYAIAVREVLLGRLFEDTVDVVTEEGWYIVFDEKTDIPRALENLTLVLEKHITDRQSLEYVDIRFEGKVFYK